MVAIKAKNLRRACMVDVSVPAARMKTMSILTRPSIGDGELQRCYVPTVLIDLASKFSWRIQRIPVPRSSHK